MKIKGVACKCGNNEIFVEELINASNTGAYCKNCGKWIKWLNKDEKRLAKYLADGSTDYVLASK